MSKKLRFSKRLLGWFIALVMAVCGMNLAPGSMKLYAASVSSLTVALADGSVASDGQIRVSSVSGASGTLYYLIAESQGRGPAAGAVIGSVRGAAMLSLNTDISDPVAIGKWVRVYATDASGNITGYGSAQIAWTNIGTIIGQQASATVTANAAAGSLGNPSWTDYTITAKATMTSYVSTASNQHLQLRFRVANGKNYNVFIGTAGYITIQPNYDPRWGQSVGGSFTLAGVTAPNNAGTNGTPIYLKLVVSGNNFQLFASTTATYPSSPQINGTDTDATALTAGNIGWYGSNASGTLENIAVTRAASAPPSGTAVTGVAINNTSPLPGDVLTATATPSGATVNYEWSTYDAVNGDVVVGTGSTYTMQAGDAGKTISVTAMGTGSYSGSATSADTKAVTMQNLTVALDANAANVSDGKVKVTSVTGGTAGSSLYYVLATSAGSAPTSGNPISGISGAASLSLNTDIGSALNNTYYVRVYQTDGSGKITGYGSVQVTAANIGTAFAQQALATITAGATAGTLGDASLTDYTVETTAVMTSYDTAASNQCLQLRFRNAGSNNYIVFIGPSGYIALMPNYNPRWGQTIGSGFTLAGVTAPNNAGTSGTPIHIKLVVSGNNFQLYAYAGTTGSYPVSPQINGTDTDATALTAGNVGWYGSGASGRFENLTVTRNGSSGSTGGGGNGAPSGIPAGPGTTGSGHPSNTKITGASIRTLAAPATGNYPSGLYCYGLGSGTNTFTETLSWSPAITNTFAANTTYTATLTLTPGKYQDTTFTTTFLGVALSSIGNLPASSTYSSISSTTAGDSMIITIVFNPTGAATAARQQLFFDDFSGTSLDTSKWNLAPSWDRQGNSTWNTPGVSGLVTVANSNLVLSFKMNPAKGPNWIDCGAVRTRSTDNKTVIWDNSYGYYEAKIKPLKVTGMWGAFWLMNPNQNQNPMAGAYASEIDILETIGNPTNGFNGAIYWNGYGLPAQNGLAASGSMGSGTKTPTDVGINIYDGNYHVFGLAWTPTQYIWYVDGVQFYSYNVPANINQNPDYIKLTMESASWSPSLGASSGSMYIDYVAVYNQPPAK